MIECNCCYIVLFSAAVPKDKRGKEKQYFLPLIKKKIVTMSQVKKTKKFVFKAEVETCESDKENNDFFTFANL